MTRTQVLLLAGIYTILMAAVSYGMIRARVWSQGVMDGQTAQREWQSFRDDVVVMNQESPVRRRVPKSVEPPGLVLMRDHFAECTAIALVLSTALYATCAFFAIGVWNSGARDSRRGA